MISKKFCKAIKCEWLEQSWILGIETTAKEDRCRGQKKSRGNDRTYPCEPIEDYNAKDNFSPCSQFEIIIAMQKHGIKSK